MLHLVTALACEARPLIRRYKLESLPSEGNFRLFAGDGVRLVVSGPGKVAAAAAVGFLRGYFAGEGTRAWLNVGIAGHGDLPIGLPVLAHKIRDAASGQVHYPVFAFPSPCPSAEVVTVDRVERIYEAPAAYEMEASGFFAAASRFATAEVVHVLKIISDNRASGAENVSDEGVEDLIAGRLDLVEALRGAFEGLLVELNPLEADPPHLRELLGSFRFTRSEEHRLRRALQRLSALGRRSLPDSISGSWRGRDVLRAIEGEVGEAV